MRGQTAGHSVRIQSRPRMYEVQVQNPSKTGAQHVRRADRRTGLGNYKCEGPSRPESLRGESPSAHTAQTLAVSITSRRSIRTLMQAGVYAKMSGAGSPTRINLRTTGGQLPSEMIACIRPVYTTTVHLMLLQLPPLCSCIHCALFTVGSIPFFLMMFLLYPQRAQIGPQNIT